MMNVTNVLKPASQFLNTNAPAILTAFGAVGVVGTAVMTARATFEAADILRDARLDAAADLTEESGRPLTQADYESLKIEKFEAFKLVWLNYLPAATTGALSISAIVMSHRISSKRAAMLAAAYALNEGKLEEYQEKVKEKLGVKKEQEVRDEIAQDRVSQLSADGFAFANPLTGKVWIMEAYTGRPFLSTIEEVKHAVNEINHNINKEGSARLSDFYDLIGLPHVSTSDYFGFTREDNMSLDWTTTASPDGSLAVHVFDYVKHPIMNPEREASFLH